MYLDSISLLNFRNYIQRDFKFDDGINAIIADNGSGKTNLLESIFYCSYLRSFRISNDSNLINKESEYFCINLIFNQCGFFNNIRINYNNKEKNIFYNEKKIKKHSELLGKLLTIIFSSDDINIIKGQQAIRRKFFNSFLSIIDYEYLDLLKKYNEIIKQKNYCLKINDDNLLNLYDIQFIEVSRKIFEKRKKYNDQFALIFSELFFNYTNNNQSKLIYHSYIDENILFNERKMSDYVKKYNDYDKKRGFTSIGPHKDNYYFLLNNNKFENYASLGQCRLAGLIIKLVQKKMFELHFESKPILLLDDVIMELDEKRKSIFLNSLFDGNQVILTLTDENNLKYFSNSYINKIML